MTVIAWDGNTLAVDMQINKGELKYRSSKMERLDTGEVIAWSGLIDAGLILAKWYKDGADPEKFPYNPKDESFADLVVAGSDGVKVYCQSPHPHIPDGPMAWGSGALAAMGAMKMGADAIRAVGIASEVSNSCGMGVESYGVICCSRNASQILAERAESDLEIRPATATTSYVVPN